MSISRAASRETPCANARRTNKSGFAAPPWPPLPHIVPSLRPSTPEEEFLTAEVQNYGGDVSDEINRNRARSSGAPKYTYTPFFPFLGLFSKNTTKKKNRSKTKNHTKNGVYVYFGSPEVSSLAPGGSGWHRDGGRGQPIKKSRTSRTPRRKHVLLFNFKRRPCM